MSGHKAVLEKVFETLEDDAMIDFTRARSSSIVF